MTQKASNPVPKPPKYLRKESKRFFIHIVTNYALEDHHFKILIAMLEALDRAAEAREAIERDGPYTKNRFAEMVKHPAIGVQRDSLIVFSRLLRELDLDIEPPIEAARPPQLRSIRRGGA